MPETSSDTLTAVAKSYTPNTRWSASSWVADPSQSWSAERATVTFEVTRATMRSQWFEHLLWRLRSLLSLRPNWNGYGELPVHPASAKRVVALLNEISYVGDAPAVVPLPDGGLQLEWHHAERSLEVEVPPNGPAVAWIYTPKTEDEWIVTSREGLQLFEDRVREFLAPS